MSQGRNRREEYRQRRDVPDVSLAAALSLGAWGFVYGLVLVAIGFLLAGAGEGTFFPILVFSSPLGFANGCIAFLAPPAIWSTVAICLAEFKYRRARFLFLAIMGLHYLGAVFLSIREIPFEHVLKECRLSPDLAVLGLVIYGVGQLTIWAIFLLQCLQHRVQFTIRGLLIGTAVLAIPLAWIGTAVLESDRDWRILSELGHLQPDAPRGLGAVTSLRLEGVPLEDGRERGPVHDDDLRVVARLRSLKWLSLAFQKDVTDAGLAHLKGLENLRELDLHECGIGDDGLRHVAEIATLETLDVGGTNVSDSGLRHLAVLKNLRWLGVDDTRVTDAGVQALKHHLPRLEVVR